MVDKSPPKRERSKRVLESRPKARLPDIRWSDPLIVLPVKAEDVGDWRGVVRSKIRVHSEAVGDVPSDEEEVPTVQGRGKRSRSDGLRSSLEEDYHLLHTPSN
jgi:hypothetical protein